MRYVTLRRVDRSEVRTDMRQVDHILNAAWVIPIEPPGEVLPAHAVVTDGERIVDILPSTEAAARYTATRITTREHHALIPGLINCHTHAAMSLLRGFADDLPLKTWLEDHIWPAETRAIDRRFVHDGTILATAEMLRSGTTCFNDMYFFPDEAAAAATETGIRAVVGMIVVDFASAWADKPHDYLRKGQQVHDQYRHHPTVTTAFAPHAHYTVDDTSLDRIAVLAEELDVQIHMHVHETQREVDDYVASTGLRPLARLAELGLLSHRLQAVHMTALSDAEISTIAQQGVSVVHCPESNLKLASGACPLAALVKAGVNVALGTDGAASNNDLDMLGEIRSAALLAKYRADDAAAIAAEEILRIATLGGAIALGREDDLGTLAVGKLADIVAFDLGGFAAAPVYDPISQIVYAGHRDQVTDVWVGGRQVVADRQLCNVDERRVKRIADHWGGRISGLR